jgi:hypothetical protein
MTMTLVFITDRCMFCDERTTLHLDPLRYARWASGELIQNVWPEWSPERRALLSVGTHPWCAHLDDDEPEGLVVGEPIIHWPDNIWNEEPA